MPDLRPLLPIVLLTGACAQGSSPTQMCTLIGCESGLEVRIEPPPTGAYRVEAQAAGDSTRSFQCPAGGSCGGTAFFRDFMPTTATMRLIVAGDTTIATVTPQYSTLQPNGPACPPTCRRGTATVRPDAND